MLRHTRKTEIHSISVVDGKRTLLFSDEGAHLEIRSTGALSSDAKAYILGHLARGAHRAISGIPIGRGDL